MATIDNDSAVEFTANWTDALTGLGFYSALTGGTRYGYKAFASAASPASGATFRIPAGDLDMTLAMGNDFEDAFPQALLDLGRFY